MPWPPLVALPSSGSQHLLSAFCVLSRAYFWAQCHTQGCLVSEPLGRKTALDPHPHPSLLTTVSFAQKTLGRKRAHKGSFKDGECGAWPREVAAGWARPRGGWSPGGGGGEGLGAVAQSMY